MKQAMRRAFIVTVLLLALVLGMGPASAAVVVQPGTTTILVSSEAFVVTTDRTITVDLAFPNSSQLTGTVGVNDGQNATVTITWRDPRLTIFNGLVVQQIRIRYNIPPAYQTTEDAGHTEK